MCYFNWRYNNNLNRHIKWPHLQWGKHKSMVDARPWRLPRDLLEVLFLLLDVSSRNQKFNVFFLSWPYPRRVFQCIGLWNTIRYGVPYEMVLRSIFTLVILVLFASSSSSHWLSTILSGRVLQRGWPGSIVLAGVRHAAVNKVVPLTLVHSLYSPLVTT